jgi:serine/threonine protein kinase
VALFGMDPSSIGPGFVMAGKYRLDALLGKGGMGSVWKAYHLTLESPIALKLIDPTIASSEEARARFMREARAAAALRSPNVVQTFDFGVEDGVPFIAMEMLIGESLQERLTRQRVLHPAVAAQVMTQVCRAIGKAHEAGIIHRDLKPDNIFIVRNEDEEVAKVLDFGVAKATGRLGDSAASKTATGAILGTPYYMSPEQAQGNKSVDWRTDLWALAVITFEALVGRRPFESDGLGDLLMQICAAPIPIPSQHAQVPPGFDAWFSRATQRDVTQRFQSAKEQAAALRTVLVPEAARASMGSYAEGIPGHYPIPHQTAEGSGSGPGLAGSAPGAARATSTPNAMVHTPQQLSALDSPSIPKKSAVGLLVAVAIVGLLVVVGVVGGAMAWLGSRGEEATAASPDDAASALASTESEPEEPKVEPAGEASAATAETEPAPSASVAAAPESPKRAVTKPAPARRAAAPRPVARPAPAAKPRPAPKPTPAPRPTRREDRLGF